MNIKTIIVDDEPHAREGIKLRLREFPEIEIIGTSDSGNNAVKLINELNPHLVFLDIQMPGLNGFEVLQKIKMNPMPFIIFVTAYDKYAIKAFEFHALDYLLKPIDDKRFVESVSFAIAEFNHRHLESNTSKLRNIVESYLTEDENGNGIKKPLNRLLIKTKNEIFFIQAGQVDWIESAGDYVYVHFSQKKHIIRETLISLEQLLDPQKFLRIHRSIIVNIDKINKLKYADHGDFEVFLLDGTKLKLSRTYRSNFEKIMGYTI